MTLDHPLLQRLYEYWNGKRAGQTYPGREQIDPLELRFMLGSLILVDIEPAPQRFRYRLFGSEIVRRQGFDMTGKYLDQHPWPELADLAKAAYLQVLATGEPTKIRRDGLIGDQYVRHDSLILPLGHEQVEMLLIGVVFGQGNRAEK